MSAENSGSRAGSCKRVKLTQVRYQEPSPSRAGIDQEAAREYGEAYKAAKTLPRPILFWEPATKCYWVGDGKHRIVGAVAVDLKELDCDVFEGDQRTADLYSLECNDTHGLRPTNKDKESKVRYCLADAEWAKKSIAAIAAKCRVSHAFATKIAEKCEADAARTSPCDPEQAETAGPEREETASAEPPAPRTREGADGKQYPAKNERNKKTSPKPDPTDGNVYRDTLGRVIPAGPLRDAFGDRVLQNAVEQLGRYRQAFKDQGQWNHWLRIGDAVDCVDKLREILTAAIPAVVCARCEGRCCEACRQDGWIPAWHHEELNAYPENAA